MESEKLAENPQVEALIKLCFEYIVDEDIRKFVKKFHDQPHNSEDIMNTVGELVLGAYLSRQGFLVRYDLDIDGKTPDWSLLNSCLTPYAIVELANFNIDLTTQLEIEEQLKFKRIATYWQDGNRDNLARLYESIQTKALYYRDIVKQRGFPYIIAIYPKFLIKIDFKEEVCPILFDPTEGLFTKFPWVSGILFFEDCSNGQYSFQYALNPVAATLVPIGYFPSRAT